MSGAGERPEDHRRVVVLLGGPVGFRGVVPLEEWCNCKRGVRNSSQYKGFIPRLPRASVFPVCELERKE
jgi:hypothetical protein